MITRRRLLGSLTLASVSLLAACASAAAPASTSAPAPQPTEAPKPAAAAATTPAAAPTAPAAAASTPAAAASTPAAAASNPAPTAKPATSGTVRIQIDIGAAGIKDEAVTGRPGEGKFGTWYEMEVFTSHLDTFNAQNPTVKAEVDWFAGRPFDQKLLARKAAGQLGDIVHGLGLPIDVAARNEIWRPLDDLVKNQSFDLKQYYATSTEVLRFDPKTGKHGGTTPLYGLPTISYGGSVVLFYNAAMFDKKGVKPPTTDMSFDDLAKTGAQMTERKQGAEVADVYGWLLSPFWGGDLTYTWIRDFGGEPIDKDGTKAMLSSPEAMAAFQFIYNGIYKDKVSPRPDQLQAMGQYKNMFLQQKLAMFRLAPWGVLATSDMPLKGEKGYFDWAAVRMPKGPSGQRGSWLTSSSIGMTPNSKYPDEAFKVLAWVTNKDAGVLQCFNAGGCGPRPDVLEDEKVKANTYLAITNAAVAEARGPYFAANGRDSEYGGILNKEIDKLLNDQVKPDKAFFDNLTKLVQDVLDKPPA